MKKFFLILFVSVFLFSCNKENKGNVLNVASGEKEYIYVPDISVDENQLVIVRISSGKKVGKWPNQDCEGRQNKQCWLWFPKDQLGNNSFELYEDYAFLSFDGSNLCYYQPRYNLLTGDEMYKYTQILSNGKLNVSDTVLVSDSFVLEELGLSSSFIIKPGEYFYEYLEDDYIALYLDMEMVETTELAYCLIDVWDNFHNYGLSSWYCYVGDVGYIDIVDSPLGILGIDENQCFVVDFYYDQQGLYGELMLDVIRAEGYFNLRRPIVIDAVSVLNVLNSDTIDISMGNYDIEDDGEKLRVNFGYVNL